MDERNEINSRDLEAKAEAILAALPELLHGIETVLCSNAQKATQAQLKAVSGSIRQLTNQGIAIPDELRRLKMTLSAKESALEEVVGLKARVLSELRECIRSMEPQVVAPQTPQSSEKSRKKKKASEGNVLDLFSWKAEGQ